MVKLLNKTILMGFPKPLTNKELIGRVQREKLLFNLRVVWRFGAALNVLSIHQGEINCISLIAFGDEVSVVIDRKG